METNIRPVRDLRFHPMSTTAFSIVQAAGEEVKPLQGVVDRLKETYPQLASRVADDVIINAGRLFSCVEQLEGKIEDLESGIIHGERETEEARGLYVTAAVLLNETTHNILRVGALLRHAAAHEMNQLREEIMSLTGLTNQHKKTAVDPAVVHALDDRLSAAEALWREVLYQYRNCTNIMGVETPSLLDGAMLEIKEFLESNAEALAVQKPGVEVTVVPRRLLIVEDEPVVWQGFKFALAPNDFAADKIDFAANKSEAEALLHEHDYTHIMLDGEFPDNASSTPRQQGLELLKNIHEGCYGRNHEAKVVICSGSITQGEAEQAGADYYLKKPVDINALRAVLAAPAIVSAQGPHR